MTTDVHNPVNPADRMVIRSYLLLLRELMATESRAQREQNPLPAPEGQAAETLAELKELEEGVVRKLDMLMTDRLFANRRATPLIRMADTDRIVGKMFEGEPVTGETRATMTVIETILNTVVAARINFLRAIDDDPYAAFWRFVQAVTNEAASSRSLPTQVVQLPGGRIAVYRACMTPESWKGLTSGIASLMAGISASTVFGGIASAVDDDEAAALLTESLSELDAQQADQRRLIIRRVRTYYTKLGREIWSTVPE